MKRVVTFGEIMMRLIPEGYGRFQKSSHYRSYYGGAEANSAETIAQLGIESRYVTKLPAHTLGEGAVNSLRGYGVDTSYVVRGGDRLGLYFMENGTSQRPAQTIYDRAHSAIAEAKAEEFDWDEILDGADWFQFSGITPALSPEMAKATLEACQTAKKKGLVVSCDLNYRSKMWSPAQARKVMDQILPLVDVFIANDKDVLGMYDDKTWTHSEPKERALEILNWMNDRYHFKAAAMILVVEMDYGRKGTWGALLSDGKIYQSRDFLVDMVESVGAGDTFAGALIVARLKGLSGDEAVNYAAAASALKFSVPGDASIITEDDICSLMKRSGSDWIAR